MFFSLDLAFGKDIVRCTGKIPQVWLSAFLRGASAAITLLLLECTVNSHERQRRLLEHSNSVLQDRARVRFG